MELRNLDVEISSKDGMGLALLHTADTLANTTGMRNRTIRKRWFLTNILLGKLFDSTAMLWDLTPAPFRPKLKHCHLRTASVTRILFVYSSLILPPDSRLKQDLSLDYLSQITDLYLH
jgi:hypothetical protein